MNTDQIKALLRWLLASISGAMLGWLAAKNIMTPDQLAQVGSFMTSETFVSTIVAIGTLAWSLLTHTPAATVAAAAKRPEVKTIEMESTLEGKKIRDKIGSTPEATITVAPKINFPSRK